MSIYTYDWIGINQSLLLDQVAVAIGPKLILGPVLPKSAVTIDTGATLLSADDETDLNQAMLRQGWSFLSKV